MPQKCGIFICWNLKRKEEALWGAVQSAIINRLRQVVSRARNAEVASLYPKPVKRGRSIFFAKDARDQAREDVEDIIVSEDKSIPHPHTAHKHRIVAITPANPLQAHAHPVMAQELFVGTVMEKVIQQQGKLNF